jgi:hypothetical protein
MCDMSVDLAFSPRSQNGYSDSFRNPELGSVENFLVQDPFAVDDFQGGFNTLDTMETDQSHSSTYVVPPQQAHSTCCCRKPSLESDGVLTSRQPSQPCRSSFPLTEAQDTRPIPCHHTVSHIEPQAYTLAPPLRTENCSRCTQNSYNRSASILGPSRRTEHALKADRSQPLDRMGNDQSNLHSTSYAGSHQRTMSVDNCDNAECQQCSTPSSQLEDRTQVIRREISHPSRSRLTASISHDILAEHGIDLADILRVSSTSRRQSHSDGTRPLITSLLGQRPSTATISSRVSEPPRGTEDAESRCDKIVILYLRGDGEEGEN